jgi:sialidase-1
MKYFTALKNYFLFICLVGILFLFSCGDKLDEPRLEQTRIFFLDTNPEGVDYLYNYRIPSLVVTKEGTVLAFVNKRKAPKDSSRLDLLRPWGVRDWGHETDVCLLRSTDGGKTWEAENTVASKDSIDIHNGPTLVDYQTGRIYKFMRFHPAWNYDTSKEYAFNVAVQQMRKDGFGDYYVKSDDDGKTWTEPESIYLPYPDNAIGCGVGNGIHGIQLKSGRLVIQGKYYILSDAKTKETIRTLFYSDDHGKTWNHGARIHPDVAISSMEFPIVETNPNEILINFRNRSEYRIIMRSTDGGLSVSDPVQDKNLLNPKTHAGIVRYSDKDSPILLFSCPGISFNEEVGSIGARNKLTVYLSPDGGKSWSHKRLLNEGISVYSDIAVLPDGTILCLYESGEEQLYEFLEFARFNIEWLTENQK